MMNFIVVTKRCLGLFEAESEESAAQIAQQQTCEPIIAVWTLAELIARLRNLRKGQTNMVPILEVDLEQEEIVLNSVAAAAEAVTSELNSYVGIPLGDLTDDQILNIATNGDFITLHRRSKEVGMLVMKFVNYFERFKPLVVSMKAKFGGRGSRVRIEVDGKFIHWAEYCQIYYGCSYRWVQKLLEGDYVHIKGEDAVDEVKSAADATEGNGDADVEKTETKKPSKKDLEIQKLEDNIKTLHTTMNLCLAEKDEEIEKLRLRCAEQKHDAQVQEEKDNQDYDPDFDAFSFVLDYFQPITKPLSFFSEIDRLIRACKMQEHGKTVLNELAGAATSQEAL
jgi:hypothetical protein